MIRFKYSILSFVAVFGLAGSVQAQHITTPYRFLQTSQEVGLYVAHIEAKEGAVGLGAKNGQAYGARYSIRLSNPLTIDVDAMYFPSERAVLDTVVVDSAFKRIGTAKQNLVILLGSARLNLTGARTWHRMLPYVTFGGGGVIETAPDNDNIEKAPVDARFTLSRGFAGTFGAGIELFAGDRIAIRLDGRNVLWKVKTPAALLRTSLSMPADEWLGNLTGSAGLSIHF